MTQTNTNTDKSQDEGAGVLIVDLDPDSILDAIDQLCEALWQTNSHDLPQDCTGEVSEKLQAWVKAKYSDCFCNAPTHRGTCSVE